VNKNRKKQYGGKIRGRVVATLLLVCFVPVLLIGVINFKNTIEQAKESARKANEKLSYVIKDDIMSLVDSNMTSVGALASSPFTREFIKNPDLGMDEMLNQLARIDETAGEGNSTAVADASGFQIARGKGDCVEISEREYYKLAMSGKTNVSGIIASLTSGTRVIVCAVPVYDLDGKVIGTAQRNINLDWLGEYLAGKVSGTEEALITDEKGMVIAHSTGAIPVDEEIDMSGEEFFISSAASGRGTLISESDGKKKILSYEKEPDTGWVVAVTVDYDEVMGPSYRQAVINLIISLIIFVIVALTGLWLSKYFTDPIRDISEKLTLLSNGQFSSVEGYSDRNDEFGAMARSTNILIDRLHTVVDAIKSSSGFMNESVDRMASSSQQMERSADSVSESVEGIVKGTAAQAKETQNESGSISEMSDSVEILLSNSEELNSIIENLNEASKNSALRLESLSGSSRAVTEDIQAVSGQIEATSEAVSRINSRVDVINEIAARTNLLSLNASIEAARAGEAGRGFAVVAEEVGRLAAQSSDSADAIRLEMKELLDASNRAVERSKGVSESVSKQQEDIELAVRDVNSLISDIETTALKAGVITDQAGRCEKAKDAVIRTLSALTDMSEQNAVSSVDTSSAVREFNSTVGDLADSANELKKTADDLKENIAFFK